MPETPEKTVFLGHSEGGRACTERRSEWSQGQGALDVDLVWSLNFISSTQEAPEGS